jgi:hypothetical protein
MIQDVLVLLSILGGASLVTYLCFELTIRSKRAELEVKRDEILNRGNNENQ